MYFPEASFDVVIEKATLDSVLVFLFLSKCGENSTVNANKMISEVHRVLSKNGVYLVVSLWPARIQTQLSLKA